MFHRVVTVPLRLHMRASCGTRSSSGLAFMRIVASTDTRLTAASADTRIASYLLAEYLARVGGRAVAFLGRHPHQEVKRVQDLPRLIERAFHLGDH